QAGATTAYIAANFNNSGSPGTISNWMLTPEMSMSDGDTLSFWTRTVTGSTFPDRLQVRLSTAGSSTNVGVGANDVGDFTTLLLDINPSLLQGGYPDDWAQYTITLSGLPGGMADGRVAWRYFVTDAGPTGANSNYIGIDTVEYVAGMAEPCTALADIPWLSVSPSNGSNGGGTNTNVTATFDSTGLADGVYTGNLCITSNDPDAGPGNGTDLVIVPVTLTVRPPTAVVVTNLAAESADLPAGGTAAAVSAFLAALLTVVVVSYRQRRQRR
ncbi:MAG: choice-of-anchor J domain-containing protein, partial [Anaerolineae bacterium]|nr:choice-of-anchor J domain-containing protein [Anaerolineae bacterium]